MKGKPMSHFYGSIPYSARKTTPTARGHKNTGIITKAASWKGAVQVDVFYDDETNTDKFIVRQVKHHGAGVEKILSEGILGE
jgi:hypothetical protein